jgi:hypothetical protein
MPFYSDFLGGFTSIEQQSEIVQRVAGIGQNTEKALLEDLNVYINSSTEIINFPQQRLRSWLSFFLKSMRNVVSAEGEATITIPQNLDPDLGKVINKDIKLPVMINSGDQLTAVSGKIFTVQDGVAVVAFNEPYRFKVIQGVASVFTGTYSQMITKDAKGVDLTSISITVNGSAIQRADLIGSQIIPWDGFFAFVHKDILHIKIFKGPNTPDPEGGLYEVHYRLCDGASGNITTISGLNGFRHTILDADFPAHKVDYTLENTDMLNGLDAPTRPDLINALRSRFWVTNNVASVPEYTAWFKEQPEVGDARVVSDYERWRSSGKKAINVTGIVDVYLMDRDGYPLSDSTIDVLDTRLYGVRDIAILQYHSFEYVKHSFLITYTNTSNPSTFFEAAKQNIERLYDLHLLREASLSLFEELDMELVRTSISNIGIDQQGIAVFPYHAKQFLFVDRDVASAEEYPVGPEFRTTYYDGESFDGFYEWETTIESEGEYKRVMISFYEQASAAEDAALIYQRQIGIDSVRAQVGTRQGGEVVIHPRNPITLATYSFMNGDRLRCYWPLKNKGLASVNVPNAARALMDVKVTQADFDVFPPPYKELETQ